MLLHSQLFQLSVTPGLMALGLTIETNERGFGPWGMPSFPSLTVKKD